MVIFLLCVYFDILKKMLRFVFQNIGVYLSAFSVTYFYFSVKFPLGYLELLQLA